MRHRNEKNSRLDMGREGEKRACRFLRKQGYRILERNCKTRLGELDIVALQGDVVSFVEVKSRTDTDFLPPEASVTAAKRRKLARLARAYLAREGLSSYPCRFDVVSVTFSEDGAVCELIQDASRVEGR
jgi:putative endonuclease